MKKVVAAQPTLSLLNYLPHFIPSLTSPPPNARRASLQECIALKIYDQKCQDGTISPRTPTHFHDLDIAVHWTWPAGIWNTLFGGVNMDRLRKVADILLVHFPSLFCQFVRVGDTYYKCPPDPSSYRISHSNVDGEESFSFFAGTLRVLRVELITTSQDTRLTFMLNHIYGDATSGFGVLAQLAKAYSESVLLDTLQEVMISALAQSTGLIFNSREALPPVTGLTSVALRSLFPARTLHPDSEALSLGQAQHDAMTSPAFSEEMIKLREKLSDTQRFEYRPSVNPSLSDYGPSFISNAHLSELLKLKGINAAAILNFLAALTAYALNGNHSIAFRSPQSVSSSDGHPTYRSTAIVGEGSISPNSTLIEYAGRAKAFRNAQRSPHAPQALIPAERQIAFLNQQGFDAFLDGETNVFRKGMTGAVPFCLPHLASNFQFQISLGQWSDPTLYDPKLVFVLKENETGFTLEIIPHKNLPEDSKSVAEALYMALFRALVASPQATAECLLATVC